MKAPAPSAACRRVGGREWNLGGAWTLRAPQASRHTANPVDWERGRSQRGFTLATVLGFITVLGILGTVVLQSMRTDIAHAGKDSRRIRAELAAESAAQWALLELSRRRAGKFPFTLATHDRNGTTRMPQAPTGPGSDRFTGPWPLRTADMAAFPGATLSLGQDGWATLRSASPAHNLSGGDNEELAFKAWYPDDTTLRVSARSKVDGSQARIEVKAVLKQTAQPL